MRVIQLTDLHLSEEYELSKDQTNPWETFKTSILASLKHTPDLIVISGDLCADKGNINTYNKLQAFLDNLKIQIIVIGGNHDSQDLHVTFNTHHHNNYFTHANMIFLDSIKGVIDPSQLKWLARTIERRQRSDHVIFMHHPPIHMDVPYMDRKHALKNIKELRKTLSPYTAQQFYFFCGHYHLDKNIKEENYHVFTTPSPAFNLKPKGDQIEIISGRAAFRIIDIEKEKFSSNVVYLN